MNRKIWKTTVMGVGPFVVENENGVITTTREIKDAQEIANIPKMVTAINETINYLSDSPDVLKLSKEDLLTILLAALAWSDLSE